MTKKSDSQVDLWAISNQYGKEGYRLICGVDEAGRGPLAGPVFRCGGDITHGFQISGLNDSKQLSDEKAPRIISNYHEGSNFLWHCIY